MIIYATEKSLDIINRSLAAGAKWHPAAQPTVGEEYNAAPELPAKNDLALKAHTQLKGMQKNFEGLSALVRYQQQFRLFAASPPPKYFGVRAFRCHPAAFGLMHVYATVDQ